MQEYFYQLADHLTALLRGKEISMYSFSAEDSDFVRFNRSAVRQAGTVMQRYLSLSLINSARHSEGTITVSGDFALDCEHAAQLLTRLREKLSYLPDDPHLRYATEVHSAEHHGKNQRPEESAVIVAAILEAGRGRDLVGFYAAGGIRNGFANSFGQRNWFSSYSYNFDWSFYHQGDKAVKESYAGFVWDPTAFAQKVETAAAELTVLAQPPRTIEPGR